MTRTPSRWRHERRRRRGDRLRRRRAGRRQHQRVRAGRHPGVAELRHRGGSADRVRRLPPRPARPRGLRPGPGRPQRERQGRGLPHRLGRPHPVEGEPFHHRLLGHRDRAAAQLGQRLRRPDPGLEPRVRRPGRHLRRHRQAVRHLPDRWPHDARRHLRGRQGRGRRLCDGGERDRVRQRLLRPGHQGHRPHAVAIEAPLQLQPLHRRGDPRRPGRRPPAHHHPGPGHGRPGPVARADRLPHHVDRRRGELPRRGLRRRERLAAGSRQDFTGLGRHVRITASDGQASLAIRKLEVFSTR